MIKATTSSLLALSVLTLLAACSKEQPPAQPAATPETPTAAAQPAAPHPAPSTSAATDVDLSGITKAEGGKTVAELFAEKDALAGTQVTVRGRVVKTNAGIMGKNWVHVRDGSGTDDANDLTVTIAGALPSVGDTVVVSGQLSVNKDYGMGYQYGVIIEDADMTVEAAGS